jgi:hypothetical protein
VKAECYLGALDGLRRYIQAYSWRTNYINNPEKVVYYQWLLKTERTSLSLVIIIVFMIVFVRINCIFRVGKFPRDTATTSPTIGICGKSTRSKVGVHYICLQSIYFPVFLKHELTRQAMWVWRSIEARSCNHCCNGKATSFTQYEYVALFMQLEIRMRHYDNCGLSGSTYFCTFLTKSAIFGKKKGALNIKYVFDFLHNFCVKYFSF